MDEKPNDIFYEAMEDAFKKLSPEDQERIDDMIISLTGREAKLGKIRGGTSMIRGLGAKSAMELIAKIGIYAGGQSREYRNLIDTIDRGKPEEESNAFIYDQQVG